MNKLQYLIVIFSIALFALYNYAQSIQKPHKSQNNSVNVGWRTPLSPLKKLDHPMKMDEEALTFVQRINDYFNAIKTIRGIFIQIDHKNQKSHGRLYIKRPGRLRLEYTPPSKLRVMSDGTWLTIEDQDLVNNETIPLKATLLSPLIEKQLDLVEYAKVIDISRKDNMASITLADKSDEAAELKLFFSIPELQLKRWIVKTPQGLDTRVEFKDLKLNEPIEDRFFKMND